MRYYLNYSKRFYITDLPKFALISFLLLLNSCSKPLPGDKYLDEINSIVSENLKNMEKADFTDSYTGSGKFIVWHLKDDWGKDNAEEDNFKRGTGAAGAYWNEQFSKCIVGDKKELGSISSCPWEETIIAAYKHDLKRTRTYSANFKIVNTGKVEKNQTREVREKLFETHMWLIDIQSRKIVKHKVFSPQVPQQEFFSGKRRGFLESKGNGYEKALAWIESLESISEGMPNFDYYKLHKIDDAFVNQITENYYSRTSEGVVIANEANQAIMSSSLDDLENYYKSDYYLVRWAIALNPNTPESLHLKMLNDTSPDVVNAAKKKLVRP